MRLKNISILLALVLLFLACKKENAFNENKNKTFPYDILLSYNQNDNTNMKEILAGYVRNFKQF